MARCWEMLLCEVPTVDDVLHAFFAAAEHTEDLQAQGMRDRLERAGGGLDVFVLVDQVVIASLSTMGPAEPKR